MTNDEALAYLSTKSELPNMLLGQVTYPPDLTNRKVPCPSCGVCPTCGRGPNVYTSPRETIYGPGPHPNRQDEAQIPSEELIDKIKKFIADREKEMAQQKLNAKGLR